MKAFRTGGALLAGLLLAMPPGAFAGPMDGSRWETIDQDDQQPKDSAIDGWVPELVSYLDAAGSSRNAYPTMASLPNHSLYHTFRGIGPDAAVIVAFLLSPQCTRTISIPHPVDPARCPSAQLIVSHDAKTITRIPRLPMCIVRPTGSTATQMRYDRAAQRIVFRTLIDGKQRPDCNFFITYPDPDPR